MVALGHIWVNLGKTEQAWKLDQELSELGGGTSAEGDLEGQAESKTTYDDENEIRTLKEFFQITCSTLL